MRDSRLEKAEGDTIVSSTRPGGASVISRSDLLGDQFSVADAYPFKVTNWADPLKVDLSGFPHVQAFQRRIAGRPAVQAAMKAEGLIR
jgi:glutathione S-transferase